MTPNHRPLTCQELANLAGCSANFIQAEIRRGHLAAEIVPAGKTIRYLIARSDVRLSLVHLAQCRQGRRYAVKTGKQEAA